MKIPKDTEEIKSSLTYFQSGMCCIYRIVGTSVNGNKNIVEGNKYISNHLGCHASRIDNKTRDLNELMGKVNIVKEDVQNLTSMTQCSHCQDSPVVGDLQMEEPSVGQPTHGQEAQKF